MNIVIVDIKKQLQKNEDSSIYLIEVSFLGRF